MPSSLASSFQRNQNLHLNERVTFIEAVLESLLSHFDIPGLNPPGDPGPEDLARTRLAGLLQWRRPGPIGDPAVLDLARLGQLAAQPEFAELRVKDLLGRLRPQPGDPGPDDIVRFSLNEIQEQLHRLAAQKIQLESMEKMLNERLAELKKTGGKG